MVYFRFPHTMSILISILSVTLLTVIAIACVGCTVSCIDRIRQKPLIPIVLSGSGALGCMFGIILIAQDFLRMIPPQ